MTETPPGGADARAARTPVHESSILVLQACVPLAPYAVLIASLVAAGCHVGSGLCLMVAGGCLGIIDPRRTPPTGAVGQ